MFFIRFLRWLLGWVRLETEGGFPEKLLRCPDDHLLLR